MIDQKAETDRLSNFREGCDLVIKKIEGGGPFKMRLLEMGFTPGVKIRIVKYAPLKDPLEIQIKNCHVSLRVCEAEKILVSAESVHIKSDVAEGVTK